MEPDDKGWVFLISNWDHRHVPLTEKSALHG